MISQSANLFLKKNQKNKKIIIIPASLFCAMKWMTSHVFTYYFICHVHTHSLRLLLFHKYSLCPLQYSQILHHQQSCNHHIWSPKQTINTVLEYLGSKLVPHSSKPVNQRKLIPILCFLLISTLSMLACHLCLYIVPQIDLLWLYSETCVGIYWVLLIPPPLPIFPTCHILNFQ